MEFTGREYIEHPGPPTSNRRQLLPACSRQCGVQYFTDPAALESVDAETVNVVLHVFVNQVLDELHRSRRAGALCRRSCAGLARLGRASDRPRCHSRGGRCTRSADLLSRPGASFRPRTLRARSPTGRSPSGRSSRARRARMTVHAHRGCAVVRHRCKPSSPPSVWRSSRFAASALAAGCPVVVAGHGAHPARGASRHGDDRPGHRSRRGRRVRPARRRIVAGHRTRHDRGRRGAAATDPAAERSLRHGRPPLDWRALVVVDGVDRRTALGEASSSN